MVRYLSQAIVRIGNAAVFRLTSVYAASKRPAAVFILAVIHKSPSAEKALPAERLHIDRHPVTGADLLHSTPGLHYLPHKLMAQNGSRHCPGHRSVFYMDITGAYGCESNFHDRIRGISDNRDIPLFKGYVSLSLIYNSTHLIFLQLLHLLFPNLLSQCFQFIHPDPHARIAGHAQIPSR